MSSSGSYTRSELQAGLKELGVRAGDTVLVRAALKPVGATEEKPRAALLNALLDLIGPEGTLIGLSFTPISYRWAPNRSHVFRPDCPAITGAFASGMLAHPGMRRSVHPTNSFVAIGKNADRVVQKHGRNASSFSPLSELIALDGKMLLIGCVEASPGFSTVHLAQEALGLSWRTILPLRTGAFFEEEPGNVRWFNRKDDPGCSAGFGKFYPLYRAAGLLRSATVGDAVSVGIDARSAYELELAELRSNPRFALCDRPSCMRCRGNLRYNLPDFFPYWINLGVRRVLSELRSKRS